MATNTPSADRDEEEEVPEGVPDMTLMPEITEIAINHNLRSRYRRDLIYTYTGSILVAVNPYRELDCYSTEYMQAYRSRPFGALPPHVFALAEAAYSAIQNGERNQSVVISGESGAGKTETTKFILQYLCASGGQATWAEQQILEANTVLEAFGNAKTVRNDNSSRFGKFVEVRLDNRGCIKGAVMRDFLLERARITGPSLRETNYHVFYQLLEGAKENPELRKTLRLRPGVRFKYLFPESDDASSKPQTPYDGSTEQGKLEALQLALTVLQVPSNMLEGLFKVLAAILWLGNLNFEDVDGERSSLAPEDSEGVEAVAELLGLPLNTAQRVLLERQINVRGNVTDIPLRLHEARENRHAMSRALYARTFAWLVRHVNNSAYPGCDAVRSLGVLDIFGFENFMTNSLEQLCINYANEKLHMFFNNYVFALEQEIYRQEGIVYNPIHFTDNASCLELLERPPRSLLKLLSEQCHMPKGSDGAYLTNVQSEFGEHQSFVKGSKRRWEEEFGVQHYAGTVTYSVEGFVDKNRDTQQDTFIDHLSRSANPFVRELADYVQDLAPPAQDCGSASPCNGGTVMRGTSKGRPTVVDMFRAQLQSLVDMLQATDVWYVRCIKPNADKEAGAYKDELVREQLKYLGMMEIVRIRRDGYPVHMPQPRFRARYKCLLKHPRPLEPDIEELISHVNGNKEDWQLGHSKVFLRSSIHAPLEAKRTALLQASALQIQKWYRGTIFRRQYTKRRSACVRVQAAWRGWRDRVAYLRMRRAAVTIQRHLRGVFAREVAAALREMKRVDEELRIRHERASITERECQELETVVSTLRAAPCEALSMDNLFDFLSDVSGQTRGAPDGQPDNHKPTIAEIGDTMDRLVGDLNNLESALGSEEIDINSIDLCKTQRIPDGAPSESIPPAPPSSATEYKTSPVNKASPLYNGSPLHNVPEYVNGIIEKANGPLSPENKMTKSESSHLMNGKPLVSNLIMLNGEGNRAGKEEKDIQDMPLPPPPPIINGQVESPLEKEAPTNSKLKKNDEPIYEPVMFRKDLQPPHKNDNPKVAAANGTHIEEKSHDVPNNTTPPPVMNGCTTTENGSTNQEQTYSNQIIADHQEHLAKKQQIFQQKVNQLNALNEEKRQSSNEQPTVKRVSFANPTTNGNFQPMSPPSAIGGDSLSEREARRKTRVEKRLQEIESSPPTSAVPENIHNLIDFANQCFNDHPRSPDATIMATLTRKNKLTEVMTKEQMVTYYKGSSIPTSHVQLHDPDSVHVACVIFRDLCRYMRGELSSDRETQIIQSIIGRGLEREDLRDEILIQCMRQVTDCPVAEWSERVWLILCLAAVAWQPSRVLSKYYCSWLRRRARAQDASTNAPASARSAHCAQWCLDNCSGAPPRALPPSTVEIAAMRRLGTIVCRFFFLDGRTKAIDVHPADTAAAAAARLADKLGLGSRTGWAIYQQKLGREEHVRATHYLYDVIAAWEIHQGAGGGSADNRFVFKRRLFKTGRELPSDPVEVALLYAQAVHSVVKLDDFPVSEKVALQLAGLQAQVALGEPSSGPNAKQYYEANHYLPTRIARTKPQQQWAGILAQAHRQYGAGRAEMTAKALYLSCVMQYPLYGVTLFPAAYKGYWTHGASVLLGIGAEGVVLVRPSDKVVLMEYKYADIATVLMDPVDNGLTISLVHHGQHDGLRCIVLETTHKLEAAWLMAAYWPALAAGLSEARIRPDGRGAGERARLATALRAARRGVVDSGILRRPSDQPANFLRNTLKRLSKHRAEKLRSDPASEYQAEAYKGFPGSFWCWSRTLSHSLYRLNDAEDVAAMQIFRDIMSHAGLSSNTGSTMSLASNSGSVTSGSGGSNSGGSNGPGGETDPEDRVTLAQTLLQRCLMKDTLLSELYMQLIKQTTDHPEPTSRVASRHWALLCTAVGVALPTPRPIRRLLLAHLRYRGLTPTGEEGKYARFAEQLAHGTASVARRVSPPSREEVLCAHARRQLHARVLTLDGRQHALSFGPQATAEHLIAMLRDQIGLNPSAAGYALFEVCGGGIERSVGDTERACDVLARWERAGAAAASCRLVFKKRLFLGEHPLRTACPVELELLYYQMLHALRNDRLPVDNDEAVMLTALHAQVILGDCAGGNEACGAAGTAGPPRASLAPQALRMHHLALRGTPPHQAMSRTLTLVQSWSLHRATIYDVMQSFTSNWPRALWLAVEWRGISLLRRASRQPLFTLELSQLIAVSPAQQALLLVAQTDTDTKHSKLVLSTDQAYQIATLIKDYIQAWRGAVS